VSEDAGGTLTPEAIRRSLDELWNMPRREPWLPADLLVLLAAEDAVRPCKARLFAPGPDAIDALVGELTATGTPVHPRDRAYLGPVQGPAPLACAREPHPDSPWHWDGRGTWWR